MRKIFLYLIICLALLSVKSSYAENPCKLCPPASPEMMFFQKADIVFIGLATNANIQYELNQFSYDPTKKNDQAQDYKLNVKFQVHTLIKGNIDTEKPYNFKIEYNGVCDYVDHVEQNKLYIVQLKDNYGLIEPIKCNSFIAYDSDEGGHYFQTVYDIISGKVSKGEGFMDGYLIKWSIINGNLIVTERKNIQGL